MLDPDLILNDFLTVYSDDQHSFSVIRSADSGEYNFKNPVQRDTVNVGNTEGDFVSIRFRTENPGPWILHW